MNYEAEQRSILDTLVEGCSSDLLDLSVSLINSCPPSDSEDSAFSFLKTANFESKNLSIKIKKCAFIGSFDPHNSYNRINSSISSIHIGPGFSPENAPLMSSFQALSPDYWASPAKCFIIRAVLSFFEASLVQEISFLLSNSNLVILKSFYHLIILDLLDESRDPSFIKADFLQRNIWKESIYAISKSIIAEHLFPLFGDGVSILSDATRMEEQRVMFCYLYSQSLIIGGEFPEQSSLSNAIAVISTNYFKETKSEVLKNSLGQLLFNVIGQSLYAKPEFFSDKSITSIYETLFKGLKNSKVQEDARIAALLLVFSDYSVNSIKNSILACSIPQIIVAFSVLLRGKNFSHTNSIFQWDYCEQKIQIFPFTCEWISDNITTITQYPNELRDLFSELAAVDFPYFLNSLSGELFSISSTAELCSTTINSLISILKPSLDPPQFNDLPTHFAIRAVAAASAFYSPSGPESIHWLISAVELSKFSSTLSQNDFYSILISNCKLSPIPDLISKSLWGTLAAWKKAVTNHHFPIEINSSPPLLHETKELDDVPEFVRDLIRFLAFFPLKDKVHNVLFSLAMGTSPLSSLISMNSIAYSIIKYPGSGSAAIEVFIHDFPPEYLPPSGLFTSLQIVRSVASVITSKNEKFSSALISELNCLICVALCCTSFQVRAVCLSLMEVLKSNLPMLDTFFNNADKISSEAAHMAQEAFFFAQYPSLPIPSFSDVIKSECPTIYPFYLSAFSKANKLDISVIECIRKYAEISKNADCLSNCFSILSAQICQESVISGVLDQILSLSQSVSEASLSVFLSNVNPDHFSTILSKLAISRKDAIYAGSFYMKILLCFQKPEKVDDLGILSFYTKAIDFGISFGFMSASPKFLAKANIVEDSTFIQGYLTHFSQACIALFDRFSKESQRPTISFFPRKPECSRFECYGTEVGFSYWYNLSAISPRLHVSQYIRKAFSKLCRICPVRPELVPTIIPKISIIFDTEEEVSESILTTDLANFDLFLEDSKTNFSSFSAICSQFDLSQDKSGKIDSFDAKLIKNAGTIIALSLFYLFDPSRKHRQLVLDFIKFFVGFVQNFFKVEKISITHELERRITASSSVPGAIVTLSSLISKGLQMIGDQFVISYLRQLKHSQLGSTADVIVPWLNFSDSAFIAGTSEPYLSITPIMFVTELISVVSESGMSPQMAEVLKVFAPNPSYTCFLISLLYLHKKEESFPKAVKSIISGLITSSPSSAIQSIQSLLSSQFMEALTKKAGETEYKDIIKFLLSSLESVFEEELHPEVTIRIKALKYIVSSSESQDLFRSVSKDEKILSTSSKSDFCDFLFCWCVSNDDRSMSLNALKLFEFLGYSPSDIDIFIGTAYSKVSELMSNRSDDLWKQNYLFIEKSLKLLTRPTNKSFWLAVSLLSCEEVEQGQIYAEALNLVYRAIESAVDIGQFPMWFHGLFPLLCSPLMNQKGIATAYKLISACIGAKKEELIGAGGKEELQLAIVPYVWGLKGRADLPSLCGVEAGSLKKLDNLRIFSERLIEKVREQNCATIGTFLAKVGKFGTTEQSEAAFCILTSAVKAKWSNQHFFQAASDAASDGDPYMRSTSARFIISVAERGIVAEKTHRVRPKGLVPPFPSIDIPEIPRISSKNEFIPQIESLLGFVSSEEKRMSELSERNGRFCEKERIM